MISIVSAVFGVLLGISVISRYVVKGTVSIKEVSEFLVELSSFLDYVAESIKDNSLSANEIKEISDKAKKLKVESKEAWKSVKNLFKK